MWRTLFRRKRPRSLLLEVRDPAGMHLRPAARLSNEAKRFKAALHLCKGDDCAELRDMHALLALGIVCGDTVTLRAEGDDANEALRAIMAMWEGLHPQTPADVQMPSDTKKEQRLYKGERIQGECLRYGIAVGMPYTHQADSHDNIDTRKFEQSVNQVLTDLQQSDNPIFRAQAALLETLLPCDGWSAFNKTVKAHIAQLQGTAMEAKIDDYHDVLTRVRLTMSDDTLSFPSEPFIFFADRPIPSLIAALPPHTQGVVIAGTSPTSHTALLLRGGNLPALLLKRLPESLPKHPVIIDAAASVLVLTPTSSDIEAAQKAIAANKQERKNAYDTRFEPVAYRNEAVRIVANVGSIQEADRAKSLGAEGIGLLRTEFLFADTLPDVAEQTAVYRTFAERFDDITVRLLDIGGDKPNAYLPMPRETNPFLGERGIRLLTRFPDLFADQLEALYRAFEGKPLKIMFPMIATPDEFNKAKAFALDVAARRGYVLDRVAFGMMVEIPSVLFDCERFNARVDFYSIGTNDLTQYFYAIERTHPSLRITDDTALMQALARFIEQATKPVSLCGELAADFDRTEMLLRKGLRTFSVAPTHIPELKERIRRV